MAKATRTTNEPEEIVASTTKEPEKLAAMHHNEIEERAYAIWLSRTEAGEEGDAEADWYAAEQELRER